MMEVERFVKPLKQKNKDGKPHGRPMTADKLVPDGCGRKLLAFARKGDVVVVWKLDRLGRSLRDLIDVVNSLQDRGVGLRSLQEAIDTTTPAGKLTFHIFAALAAARKRGVAIGRPRALTPEQILVTEAMTADPAISTRQVAEQFGVHRSTLYRHLNARQKGSA